MSVTEPFAADTVRRPSVKSPKEPRTPATSAASARAAAARAARMERAKVPPPPPGKTALARNAVRNFLTLEVQAREVRVTKLAPDGAGGWDAEADILIQDLNVKRLGLRLSQEVLEEAHCALQLDADLAVQSYEFIEQGER
jgi:hypothetical protein